MKKIKELLACVVILFIFGFAGYKIYVRHKTNQVKESDFIYIKAVIVNEKNYMGNNPVTQAFSYSYMFVVNGTTYKDNAHDPNLKIGDSIDVKYARDNPSLNKPVHPTE